MEEINKRKIIYAAMDATMPFVIFFDVLNHWMHSYKKADLVEGDEVTWNSLLKRILGPLVDRERVEAAKDSDQMVERCLTEHSAAFAQSTPVFEDVSQYEYINWAGSSRLRRQRMKIAIVDRYKTAKSKAGKKREGGNDGGLSVKIQKKIV